MSPSSTRILLLGKNGQVGWELQRSLAPLGPVIALDRDGLTPQQAAQLPAWQGQPLLDHPLCGDLSDLEGLRRTVYALRPQIIVNAAAYTAVDRAESEVGLAHRLNAEAPGVLAQAAHEVGAWLVHYSTDYVFNGSGHTPWQEGDATGPLNAYGLTKLEGEQRILQAGRQHLIFRTSWVYAARGGNFAKTMLRLARERERLTVIDDQFGAPTGAELIADVTAHALRQVLHTGEGQGTYHLAASGETTWHRYAQFVIEQARQLQPHGSWKVQAIDPVPTQTFPTPARRPHNSRLNTSLLKSTFGLHLPTWQRGVDRMLQEIL
ncbi:dTDP-4-dehydrorhamnose reductase [Azospira oryzae]|jgi:dTDP-4-dehydrorhamnose reductase|uniref:dTDP-4-dehydrorhamnose reductase n=1 Tax=Burkholderia vietnamiensis (strain G4 / LMG 22486) TaxID=269482 RepID=A4JIV3_BURVG|nr:dTDP-4-dehydrorhamnose reductase [Azospira oryzae]ABO56206.1 dTDP-4-dehydrorhamnose reductase [Burkholderia vietnamiensis G4]MCB4345972.1 dTDP-4-dehydrorhamnose reductase [Burkholderia vietnamiensis]